MQVTEGNNPDWSKADKKALLSKLASALTENERLRESVSRLMKRAGNIPVVQHVARQDDFVPVGWVERHGISIPRSDGYFESAKAWVRITHGTITLAGLKNQSILSLMMAQDMLDAGAERYAKLYSDWRAAFFARVEAARYSDVGSGNPDAWSKEDRFSKLLKAVERKHLRYVDVIVTSNPKEKDVERLNDDPETFLEAFRITARAISQINEDAEAYLEALRRGKSPAHEKNACPIIRSVPVSVL